MTVPCLVRVVSRSDRQLLRLTSHSPAEIKRDLAHRLRVDTTMLVVIHHGNILPDDSSLADLRRPTSSEVNLIAIVLDQEQCRLAEAARKFESVLASPVVAPSQPTTERNIIYEIPVHNAMEFLGSHVSASLREPLVDMGFPESRVVKALLLNGLNIERAMEWLLDHANDEDVDAPLTPYQISQLVSSLIASQGVLLSGRSASAVMRAVDAAIARRQCTYAVTRNRYVPQQFRCLLNTQAVVSVYHALLFVMQATTSAKRYLEKVSIVIVGADRAILPADACPSARPEPLSERIFSNRNPFMVTDLAIQTDPLACQPFAIRLEAAEMRSLLDLLRRLSESNNAEIFGHDIEIAALLLDVIDQIPVHVIALFAMIIGQKQGVERILQSSTLSHSLIPRVTSVCIESNVQIQILRTCLAFSINLTASAIENKQWYSFAISSFSHMISVCSSLVCNGSGIESLFAIELLGNYALMSQHIPETQRRILLSELLNGAAARTENAPLVLKLLIAFGTVVELVPSIIPVVRQMTNLNLFFDQLSARWSNLIPAITRLREIMNGS